MKKWVALLVLLAANCIHAEQTDCPVIYKALTQDHKKQIFLCETRSTMLLTIGNVNANPDILATVSYDESFIKKIKDAMGVESTQLFLPVSGKWFIIDVNNNESLLTTQDTDRSDYYPDDIEDQPLKFDKKTEVNNIKKLTRVKTEF